MAESIQLLGVPQFILQDGTLAVLRGHKAWGLLAYLATQEGAVSRQPVARASQRSLGQRPVSKYSRHMLTGAQTRPFSKTLAHDVQVAQTCR